MFTSYYSIKLRLYEDWSKSSQPNVLPVVREPN
jgi:hypothetical protein